MIMTLMETMGEKLIQAKPWISNLRLVFLLRRNPCYRELQPMNHFFELVGSTLQDLAEVSKTFILLVTGRLCTYNRIGL